VLLLGAAGNSGRLIAAELAARGLSVRLSGRRRHPLEDLARTLAADGATASGATNGGATNGGATSTGTSGVPACRRGRWAGTRTGSTSACP